MMIDFRVTEYPLPSTFIFFASAALPDLPRLLNSSELNPTAPF